MRKKAKVRTGFGKSDYPGSQGGLRKRVKLYAPHFYPDKPHVRFDEGSRETGL
jgi:hypothetical protein